MQVEQEEWYQALVDDCRAIVVEAEFTSRWALVEGYHALGQRILDDHDKWERNKLNGMAFLQGLAKQIQISARTVYYAVQFARKFPELALLPEGKDTSWNKIVTLYLPAPDGTDLPPMPTGKYKVIVIDPPWPMKTIERDVRPRQTDTGYSPMSLQQIAGLNIPYGDDCHVWLWTTHKFLPFAFKLLKDWDLKYVCTFVWHKPGGFQPFGLPQYNSEFALYAHRGAPTFLDTKDFNTCFNAPRGAHSEKPNEFYDLVRRVTAGPRLDMFNRRQIDGFKGWGKESPSNNEHGK